MIKVPNGCNLAVCGCSYASNYESRGQDGKLSPKVEEVLSTVKSKDLWVNNFTGYKTFKNFAQPGCTNYDIYLQVKNALNEEYNYILVFLTNPNRYNAWWEVKQSLLPWVEKPKFIDYVKKYHSIDFCQFYTYLLIKDMISLSEEANVNYRIFIGHSSEDTSSKEYSSFMGKEVHNIRNPNIIKWHARGQGPASNHDQTSPNHLSLDGQLMVIKRLNKYV